VVVTRAARQSDELARLLSERGAEVVHLPLIEIVDPPDGGAILAMELADLESCSWVVITSPNGAERARSALLDRPPGRPKVAAVGRATAAALGRAVDLVPDTSTAHGLVDAFPPGAGRVLLLQADRAGDTVRAGLAARGWAVRAVTAYRTLTVPPAPADAARAAAADAVVFASGSAVTGWVEAMGTRTPPVVVVIGPSTASVARSRSLQVHAIAADQTLDALVVALQSALDDSG
jgi:uroporphyrinogen-III synthase